MRCVDGGIDAPDLQQLAIKFVKDTSKIWYQPEITKDGGKGVFLRATFFLICESHD